jgi:hypothetical protein
MLSWHYYGRIQPRRGTGVINASTDDEFSGGSIRRYRDRILPDRGRHQHRDSRRRQWNRDHAECHFHLGEQFDQVTGVSEVLFTSTASPPRELPNQNHTRIIRFLVSFRSSQRRPLKKDANFGYGTLARLLGSRRGTRGLCGLLRFFLCCALAATGYRQQHLALPVDPLGLLALGLCNRRRLFLAGEAAL